MKVIYSIKEMQQYSMTARKQGKAIGFVPTMGFLHEGHEQLMKQARRENDIVVVSIFVNPLQFGPTEDFDKYPRDEKHDKDVCTKNNIDVIFFPETNEMYPNEEPTISMNVERRTDVLCGRSREGHFSGVVTVLTKLFNIISPDHAYFGRKDAQQVAVVDGLINDFNFPITLIAVPTVREADGLAKSSRNVYLKEQERKEAPILYKALELGKQMVIDGEKNPAIIVKVVTDFIVEHTRGKMDYVEILSYPELESIDTIDRPFILATAVHFESARLIDNIVMNANGTIFE